MRLHTVVLAAAITLVMIAVGMYAVVGGDSAGPTPGSSKADATTGPPQSAAGEASPRRRNAPRDVPRKLVQPAWSIADMASLPRSDVPLSALVDIEDAVGAPSLLDAPIPRAVMVLSEDISFDRESAFPDGELAILGRGGAWRELSTEDLGLLDNTNEVPFSLSRDGALLAVGDRGAVVTIDVATGEQQRFRVPFRKPIGLEWTDNNHKLHVSDRWTRTERPLLLDVRTGATTPVDYSIFTTGFDSGGTPVDVKVRAEPRKAPTPLGQADILTYPGPTRSQKTPIRVGGIYGAATATWRLLAVERWPHVRSSKQYPTGKGVLLVKPDTGQPVAMLPMENMDWTTIVGWADPQTLLIGDGHGGGHGGYLIAWDWRDQRLRVVTRFPPGQGLRYEIATDLLR